MKKYLVAIPALAMILVYYSTKQHTEETRVERGTAGNSIAFPAIGLAKIDVKEEKTLFQEEIVLDRKHITKYAKHCIGLIETIPTLSADDVERKIIELIMFRQKLYANKEDRYSQLLAARIQVLIDGMIFNSVVRSHLVKFGKEKWITPFKEESLLSSSQIDRLLAQNSYRNEEIIERLVTLHEKFAEINANEPNVLKHYVEGYSSVGDYSDDSTFSWDFINEISDKVKSPILSAQFSTKVMPTEELRVYSLANLLESVDRSRIVRVMTKLFREADRLIEQRHDDPIFIDNIGNVDVPGKLPKIYSLKTFYAFNNLTMYQRGMSQVGSYTEQQPFSYTMMNTYLLAPFLEKGVFPDLPLTEDSIKTFAIVAKMYDKKDITTKDVLRFLEEQKLFSTGTYLPVE